jgi:hypothetical protein
MFQINEKRKIMINKLISRKQGNNKEVLFKNISIYAFIANHCILLLSKDWKLTVNVNCYIQKETNKHHIVRFRISGI